MQIPEEVWSILNSDEQTAVQLAFKHSKSSWQAGEIMDKSHYKYLEIQSRAKRFLRMFSEHYLKYGQLIPPDVDMHPGLKEYFYTLIVQRKTIKEAADLNSFTEISKSQARLRLMIDSFKKLGASPKEAERDTIAIIKEFDRWNNFRVLPRELQEASAFKRRNKTKLVKHIKTLSNIAEPILKFIIKKFKTKSQENILFMPLIHRYFEEGYDVIPINNTEANLNVISDFGIFLFEEEFMAHEFGSLIAGYCFKVGKSCKDGQLFWPSFREMQALSTNVDRINNRNITRKYFEETYKKVV